CVVRSAAGDGNAGAVRVGGGRSGGIDADLVALDEVAAGPRVGDQDAGAGVAGDQVTSAGGRAADRIVGTANFDPIGHVRKSIDSSEISADKITFHQVARTIQPNSVACVSRNNVSCRSGGAANRVCCRAVDFDSLTLIRYRAGSA